jgi:chromosome segregation ATPase
MQDKDVQNIPIPTELPAAPDLKDLPTEVLHSGTVETLLQQNQDLMSRLSITIRRNAELEQELHKTHVEHQRMLRQKEAFEDETQLARDSFHKVQSENLQLRTEIEKHEKDFARVYAEAQEIKGRIADFEKQASDAKDEAKSTNVRYQSYRQKIRDKIRPYIRELKASNLESQKLYAKYEQLSVTLKKQITDSNRYIQEQGKRFEDDQRQLVEYHESRYSELEAKFNKATTDLDFFRQRAHDYENKNENLNEKNINLENQKVLAERNLAEFEQKHHKEVKELQEKLVEHRTNSTSKTSEIENYQRQKEKMEERVKVLTAENEKLTGQLEGIQTLWDRNMKELEELRKDEHSVQTLNRELTKTVQDLRKDNDRMRSELGALQDESEKKISALSQRVKILSEENGYNLLPEEKAEEDLNIEPNNEILGRIETLMAEIQSGYSSKKASDEMPAPAPCEEKDESVRKRLEKLSAKIIKDRNNEVSGGSNA